jgi:hypothetical protein
MITPDTYLLSRVENRLKGDFSIHEYSRLKSNYLYSIQIANTPEDKKSDSQKKYFTDPKLYEFLFRKFLATGKLGDYKSEPILDPDETDELDIGDKVWVRKGDVFIGDSAEVIDKRPVGMFCVKTNSIGSIKYEKKLWGPREWFEKIK